MDARRKKLIAQAHLAAKQAGCADEDLRRRVQLAVTGKASCADMTVAELVKLIDHWATRGAQVRPSAPEAAQAPGMVTRWQLATIERLAWEMGWTEGLADARLTAFLRRTARVDGARWLTREGATAVISGLLRWKRQRARQRARP
ncbi:MAG: hypothetical protein KatS3mg124_1866 [Porticoccaceae bacterium]|nr:MAG: hypothetical protein KatS3mg124_1866 [Porticoccaceae bacterium]